jgi:hypothetical protein
VERKRISAVKKRVAHGETGKKMAIRKSFILIAILSLLTQAFLAVTLKFSVVN